MSQAFAFGKKARGFCDRCGFEYKLHDLKDEVVDMHETGLKVCSECWDPDQPQLQVGRWPVSDPQALRSPRPNGEDAGRQDGWLVYDFKENGQGWTSGYGTVTHSADSESITWSYSRDSEEDVSTPTISIQNGESLSYGTTDFAVNTALYRYVRFRVRLLEKPTGSFERNRLSWFRFSNYSLFDDPISAKYAPVYSAMGSDIADIVFDMNEKDVNGTPNNQWTGTLRRMRLAPFNVPVGSSFKLEILGIYFEPIRVQPENSLSNGVENWDFTTPVFQKGNSSAFTTQGGDKIESVPGWTVTPSHGFSGNGRSKGNIGVAEHSPVHDFPRLYIRPWVGNTTKASQVTSKVIEEETKYTLNVPISGSTEGANHKYALRLKAGGALLAEATGTEPSTSEFTTRTVSYATYPSETSIGSPLEIEIANVATVDDHTVHTQLSAERVELIDSPQFTYDFRNGTATETAGGGTYGVEGWAWFEGGKVPIENSLVWNSSQKTVTLGSPNLSASNPWDNPYLTYNYSVGVPATISTSKYSSVTARMRRTAVGSSTTKFWRGVFYWIVQSRVDAGDYPFGGGDTAHVPEPSFLLNEWEEVTWDMGDSSDWKEEGVATGWRFDFYHYGNGDTDTKDIFEIDYVIFT